jgi:hypothetical protein
MHLHSLSWSHVGHSVDLERWVRIFSALLTPVIAAIVAYVAVQQWRTNRQQHRLTLFEKRMAVFNGMRKFIRIALNQTDLELNSVVELWEDVQNYKFLFESDVTNYIEELHKNGGILWATKQTLLTGGQQNRNRHHELLRSFDEQRTASNEKFLKATGIRSQIAACQPVACRWPCVEGCFRRGPWPLLRHEPKCGREL